MSNARQPLIETKKLTKKFGVGETEVEILREIDLAIYAGEFVAIMGPSGSGKSTLLSILGGIETPTTGSVLLEGLDLSQLSDNERTLIRRRRIGFIFQAFNLMPTLTAIENVALPLELDGCPHRDAVERARKSLERVEMGHRMEHLPSKLSGGEQQRVAIARALVSNPAILLADEPTGNLDSRQGQRISRLLSMLSGEQGHTIVMVTHDAHVAKSASRLLEFRDGTIEKDAQQEPWIPPAVENDPLGNSTIVASGPSKGSGR